MPAAGDQDGGHGMAHLAEDLRLLIRTRHPIVVIDTHDEQYACKLIAEAAGQLGMNVVVWSVGCGVRKYGQTGAAARGALVKGVVGTDTIAGVVQFLNDNSARQVYILLDALPLPNDPAVVRRLREAAMAYSADERTVFFVGTGGVLPESVRPLSVPFELPPPDRDEMDKLVRQCVGELARDRDTSVSLTRQDYEAFLTALRGLTRAEVAQVTASAILGDGVLNAADTPLALEAKRRRLRDLGALEYVAPPEAAPAVGGMENLRHWLDLRRRALAPEARAFGLVPPRGILLLGVQGCGKSTMARYVGSCWRMPLLRMDVGALYDRYVGETEQRMRRSLSAAEAMAPCVLWIDEVEKAFASAGVPGGSASDGGLSQRLFGHLLTWMQERQAAVFVLATANDVALLPPELLRKGRFDEVFFIDLPGEAARREIFAIHLSRRKRDPGTFDLAALAEASAGFSGSEIEQAVVAALYAAFNQSRELTTADVLAELKATRPLSVLMAERVADLRAWAEGRCVPADA